MRARIAQLCAWGSVDSAGSPFVLESPSHHLFIEHENSLSHQKTPNSIFRAALAGKTRDIGRLLQRPSSD